MADDPAPEAAEKAEKEAAPPPEARKKQRRGIVSRIWRGIFGGRGEDYEKRLKYLSKEEASVHARMKRRAQTSRRMVRNLIVFAVVAEVVAVVYAIMATRSVDLNWEMRAVRVLPIFLIPALSSVMYSTYVRFTRMLDRRDQNMLERLRAERKAKIDELKERTNYYTTQQLIQKYDLDPAAKAAAATVLASKLGADAGLKVSVESEAKDSTKSAKSNDVEMVQSSGLRNRKQGHARSNSAGSTTTDTQVVTRTSNEPGGNDGAAAVQSYKVVEHYKGSGTYDGGWIARIAALLVGEDPSQSYALICGNCHMHNGLARKEDFPHITYYCPHCHALNTSKQDSVSSSDRTTPLAPLDENHASNSNAIATAESEMISNTIQE
ncbi:Uncharacterized protein ACMD2_08447 [Ananas comosus]|uniref:Lunapark zinc ribbon domain-containing protein n=2 Tax=Ananas comosus TaxID=4615 RepID=A0A199VP31_ANACO|nr:Uncharacterized protein ACMD2_08447 [Ananas comosus]CAD1843697.1 unnamed protein product [Ananas comosus var. bracteatus]